MLLELDGLYQEYARMIYHFIYLKCHDRDLVEDTDTLRRQLDEGLALTLECYRIAEQFVYIPGTGSIRGEKLSPEIYQMWDALFS